MDEQEQVNLSVSIDNIEYRLRIIEAKLGITEVYMDGEKSKRILESEV